MITVEAVQVAAAAHRVHLGVHPPVRRGHTSEYKPRYTRCCIKDHRRAVKLSPLGPSAYGRILWIQTVATETKPATWQDRGAVCLECITAIRKLIKEEAV